MDQWFDISQRRFQLFLEFKLEIFAAVSEPIAESILLFTAARGSSNVTATGGCGDAKPPVELDGQLRCLPSSSTFLDDVHSLMAHTYIRLDDGFSGGDDNYAQHREEMEKENHKDEDEDGEEEGEDNNPFLYGELLPAGVRSLLFDTPAVAKALTPTEDDSEAAGAAAAPSFVDFGSGVGKLVFESALLLNPHFYREMSDSEAAAGAQQPQEEPQTSSSRSSSSSSSSKKNTIRCIGIELCPRRHAVAEQAMRVLPPSLLEHHAATCLHGSFFDAFEGEDSAAVVFACALGFNDAMTSQLCDRLMALHAGYHRLKVAVLLLRTIPMKHPLFSSVGGAHVKISMTSLATTWMDEAPAIVVEWL